MYPNMQEENENVLVSYGRDITEAVKQNKVDPVIGRDEEIRSIIRILSRKTKNNPVLIGKRKENLVFRLRSVNRRC